MGESDGEVSGINLSGACNKPRGLLEAFGFACDGGDKREKHVVVSDRIISESALQPLDTGWLICVASSGDQKYPRIALILAGWSHLFATT
jgi:hypothetical protein